MSRREWRAGGISENQALLGLDPKEEICRSEKLNGGSRTGPRKPRWEMGSGAFLWGLHWKVEIAQGIVFCPSPGPLYLPSSPAEVRDWSWRVWSECFWFMPGKEPCADRNPVSSIN